MDHTQTSLDTQVVLDALLTCAATTMGARALAGVPVLSRDAIVEVYAAVDEWIELASEGGVPHLGGAEDVAAPVRGAAKGEMLEPADLIAVGRTLDVLLRASTTLLEADEAPHLQDLAAPIQVDPWLKSELDVAFEPDGRLSARRYPELGTLRRQIDQIHGTLRSTLERMAKGSELADDLQDTFWTIRNDRYVLPLKPHAKNQGVVHGTSGSGKTVFVEPHEVLELNNRLRLAEGALEAEERRILRDLSRQVGAASPTLTVSLEALVALDGIQARAELARRLQGRTVRVGQDGVVDLVEARHPVLVLRGVEVVGHDLALSTDRPALVLTGPNTGGKTVALKTIGLCAWMVQRALPLPVTEGRVDRFETVLADVGDAQTVTDDLSSFSAQLVAVDRMLQVAGPGVLLLLDELASGTDPSQGAALAQAVLERLVERGARVVTTTHYPALKGLAATDPRFRSAAMEVRGGMPTYRLLPDATGESHALETAARLGLPEAVLQRADDLWRSVDAGVAPTLEALASERGALEALRHELALERAELAVLKDRLGQREERLRLGRQELEKQAAAAFEERLSKASKAIGAVVAQLQENPSHKGVAAARASLEAMRGLVPAPAEASSGSEAPAEVQAGQRVRHATLGVGEVVQGGAKPLVRFGVLQSAVRAEELELLPEASGKRPKQKKRKGAEGQGAQVRPEPEERPELAGALRIPGNTIDLRGQRVEEALDAVDRGLADALADGIRVVFVLHGHGTGALKQAVRSGLKGHPLVARHAPANSDQGGDAFTVVEVRP